MPMRPPLQHPRAHRPLQTRRGALALAILSLAAAIPGPLRAEPASEPEQANRATYLCRGRFDALPITALFFIRQPSEVVLLEGTTATRLPQQLSASGARYGSGSMEFWIKGDEASWRRGPHPTTTMQCTAQPAQSQR
jgi:membrane-bound inhibitor of C-type lysozyme